MSVFVQTHLIKFVLENSRLLAVLGLLSELLSQLHLETPVNCLLFNLLQLLQIIKELPL